MRAIQYPNGPTRLGNLPEPGARRGRKRVRFTRSHERSYEHQDRARASGNREGGRLDCDGAAYRTEVGGDWMGWLRETLLRLRVLNPSALSVATTKDLVDVYEHWKDKPFPSPLSPKAFRRAIATAWDGSNIEGLMTQSGWRSVSTVYKFYRRSVDQRQRASFHKALGIEPEEDDVPGYG